MEGLVTGIEKHLAAARRQGGGADQGSVSLAVAVVLLFVAAYIAVAYLSAPPTEIDRYFEEGAAIDVMSSLFLVMAGSFAWACCLLCGHLGEGRRLFWFLLAAGFLFVALDEMLQIHETLDEWLRDTWLGWPPLFRNWNDVIVIAYGVGGLALLGVYWRELARLPRAFGLLGLGGCFYVLHTGIDSLVSQSAAKTLVEESAKLTATAFFALAMLAAFTAMLAALRPEPAARAEPAPRKASTEALTSL